MEKELLQRAIDSILHGSEQTFSSEDGNGNIQTHTVRVNDLRVQLVQKLSAEIIKTEEFKKYLADVFAPEFVKELKIHMLAKVSYADLPWDVKKDLEKKMKETELTISKFRLIADAIQ